MLGSCSSARMLCACPLSYTALQSLGLGYSTFSPDPVAHLTWIKHVQGKLEINTMKTHWCLTGVSITWINVSKQIAIVMTTLYEHPFAWRCTGLIWSEEKYQANIKGKRWQTMRMADLWSSFPYKQILFPVIFINQQQKKWQDALCYCKVAASPAFVIKKQDSPLVSTGSCKRCNSSSQELWFMELLLGLLRQLAFLQSRMH